MFGVSKMEEVKKEDVVSQRLGVSDDPKIISSKSDEFVPLCGKPRATYHSWLDRPEPRVFTNLCACFCIHCQLLTFGHKVGPL